MRTEAGNRDRQDFMCTSRYILGVRTTTATRERVSNFLVVRWLDLAQAGCHSANASLNFAVYRGNSLRHGRKGGKADFRSLRDVSEPQFSYSRRGV